MEQSTQSIFVLGKWRQLAHLSEGWSGHMSSCIVWHFINIWPHGSKGLACWVQGLLLEPGHSCLELWFCMSPDSCKSYICASLRGAPGSWEPAWSLLVKGIVMLKFIFAPWLFVSTFPFAWYGTFDGWIFWQYFKSRLSYIRCEFAH